MTKDEIWREIKGDKTKVYGQSMFDMFLRTSESIERRHINELPRDKRNLVSPQCLLDSSTTPEEAEEAIARGGDDFGKALANAAKRGNTVMIDFFIDKLPAEYGSASISGAISAATQAGSLEGVKHLIKIGAVPSIITLDRAAEMGHLEIVKYLVSEVKFKHELSSSLWWAAYKGRLEIVKYLVSEGKVLRGTAGIDSALEAAADMGHGQVVDFLMDQEPGNTGKVLLNAMKVGRQEIADILVDKGANPEPAILWAFFNDDGRRRSSPLSGVNRILKSMLDRSERVEKIARELALDYPDVAKYMSERDKGSQIREP